MATKRKGKIEKAADEIEKAADEAHACQRLRPMLPPGSEVMGIVTQVSRDGMSRHVRLFVGEASSNEPNGARVVEVTHLAAQALSYRLNRDGDALLVGGCGMDMVFHVVQLLSYALHGYGLEEDTPEQSEARLKDGPAEAWPLSETRQGFHPRRPGYTLRSAR